MEANDFEEYVRQRWEQVEASMYRAFDRWNNWKQSDSYIVSMQAEESYISCQIVKGSTWAEAWQAAYDFTIQREEQIRRRQRTIGMLQEHLPGEMWHDSDVACMAGEVIAREQAALDELRKGMK